MSSINLNVVRIPPARHAGNRLKQPAPQRELPRARQPEPETVVMPNGQRISTKVFHDHRSNAHKGLATDFSGCSRVLRAVIADSEWAPLMGWINMNRPAYGNLEHQNDTLLAAAISVVAKSTRRDMRDIYHQMKRHRSLAALLQSV